MNHILALDQGTTTTKAILVDAVTGMIVHSVARGTRIDFPRPGHAEQSAEEIYEAAVDVLVRCAAQGDVRPRALALSNQRESVVLWSRSTGRAVGPVLGWQDARTEPLCAELEQAQHEVTARTGLALDPMFSAPKIRWLLDQALGSGHQISDLMAGTIDSWLVYRLTGNHLIEAGNASRTLLMSLDTLGWDPWLTELFGIPSAILPQIRPSADDFGFVSCGIPELDGMPIKAVMADSHAALFSYSDGKDGHAKCTYGTGSSIMVPTATRSPGATLAWLTDDGPQFAHEGNIIASGAALDWTARLLGLEGAGPAGRQLADLAAQVDSSAGVHVVPAFAGLGAPYWDRNAVGLIEGLSLGSTPRHVARAALEGVAHQICDVVESIAQHDAAEITRLFADGGASASPLLMQIQADVLGIDISVLSVVEASAHGAAKLAAQVLGHDRWPLNQEVAHYTPKTSQQERRNQRLAWSQAIARSRFSANNSHTSRWDEHLSHSHNNDDRS